MAEYIEKDAVIKKIAAEQEKAATGIEDVTYYRAIKIIRSEPAADVQPIDRWISVKDGLPNEMQDKSVYSGWSEEIRPSDSVLVLTTGGSYDVAWYSYAYNDWTTDNETRTYENSEIAFWQPLPEPPKDGDTE